MPEVRAPRPPRGPRTVLAFDFGRRRIGVAVGQEGIGTAGPLPAIRGDCPGPDWRAIALLVERWQPQLLLVGRPAALDGTATWMTAASAAFARDLEQRAGVPVERIDERLSSRAARSELAEQRRRGLRRRRVRPADVDSAAAQLILRGWIEETAAARGRTRFA
jgi:putative Holliday junction resolvase